MLGSSEFSVPAPLVNLWNMQITTSGAKNSLVFRVSGVCVPPRRPLTIFFRESGTEIRGITHNVNRVNMSVPF